MTRTARALRSGLLAALAVGLVCVPPERAAAHEIPASVTALAFVKPDGDKLRVLVRVPLESMRDIEFPLTGTQGYLDIPALRPMLPGLARLWIADYLEFRVDGRWLETVDIVATRLSLPSDRSFESFDAALANMVGRLPDVTQLPWQQAMLDVLLEYPITAAAAEFSVHPALAHLGLRTVTVLRFLPPGGAERAFRYDGDPGLVHLDPRWHQAMFRFVELGFFHILGGIDHLLFLLCLVIPFRKLRPLVWIVTSFTVAHSITLIAAAAGLAPSALWFAPFIETLIAMSIVYMALENIVGARLERRWRLTFVFGLAHGFGFSFLLRDSMQFAGAHLATSLVAFNIGVELGQILILLVAVPALDLLFKRVVAERVATIPLSALIAHTAWHWMTERGAALLEYPFAWPALDAAFLASVFRWFMVVLGIGLVWWLGSGLLAKKPGDAVEQGSG